MPGTDLGIMRTRAEPATDGSYRISGTKIFITYGDHDLTANSVHLVLAKLPDAPEGTRGISLFIVPKFVVNEDGSLGARNSFTSGSIEHKMGVKGSPTCVMNYDRAVGHLIGEQNQGLAAMFTMMNYERLSVGIQGLGTAEAAYQAASGYALERLQGRSPLGAQQRDAAADPIVAHPDVRRMLLTVRAYNEAGRAFAALVGRELDLAKYSPDDTERERAERLVGLLTPIAKAHLTDRGFEACVIAQQVFGGHGYIAEWGVEQFVRDARIAQIYEGTNGVQALDLLGRKVIRDGGATANEFIGSMRADVNGVAGEYRDALELAIDRLADVTRAPARTCVQRSGAGGRGVRRLSRSVRADDVRVVVGTNGDHCAGGRIRCCEAPHGDSSSTRACCRARWRSPRRSTVSRPRSWTCPPNHSDSMGGRLAASAAPAAGQG